MVSKEKFERFRLSHILSDVEQISSYEYYGEVWDAEVYGFTECLITNDSFKSTKILSLDLTDLKDEDIQLIFLQLELNLEELLKDSGIRKIQEDGKVEVIQHLVLDKEGYYILLKSDSLGKIAHCIIFSFIPHDIQNRFQSKPDLNLTNFALDIIVKQKPLYQGVIPYSLFEKLKLEYFLDYDFIKNYSGENKLFYGFGEKCKFLGINWIEDAVGFSSFKYLPKQRDKLRYISVDFDDFEPRKLKLLLNLLGLNLTKGLNKDEVSTILKVAQSNIKQHGDDHFFVDYKLRSSSDEFYFIVCYFSKVYGLKSFDITNYL